MKQLIIAEKPQAGKAIAQALGRMSARDGYYEVDGGDTVVTYCVGHLLRSSAPETMNPEWLIWDMKMLPMIPDPLEYEVSGDKKKQVATIKKLLLTPGLRKVVNACDAGREGDLIFWEVYCHAGAAAQVERLSISNLTQESIRKGFNELRPERLSDSKVQAAFLRAFADWVMGLNPTRAMTIVSRRYGAQGTYNLGRVQTPIISLVVNRDLEIENFVSVPFWQIRGEFAEAAVGARSFPAWHVDDELKTKTYYEQSAAAADHEAIEAVRDSSRIKNIEKKTVQVKSPSLFDLTALQRLMSTKHGFTSARTLEVAQKLYDAPHNLISYPRSDCPFLSLSVYKNDVQKALITLSQDSQFGAITAPILATPYLLTKRHVDDKKVGEHHGIIPTDAVIRPQELDPDDLLLYGVIVRRFLAAFYPSGEDDRTVIIIEMDGNRLFRASGTVKRVLGWREIEAGDEEIKKADKRSDDDEEDPEGEEKDGESSSLPVIDPLAPIATIGAVAILDKETKAPPSYTEASLLSAMQTCGKIIEDDEARLAMKDLGIGTVATRANHLENVIKNGYIERVKKMMKSTAKAREVVTSLQKTNCVLVSPELTGKWEARLAAVARGDDPPEQFRREVIDLAHKTIEIINTDASGIGFTAASLEDMPECPKCTVAGRAPAGRIANRKTKAEKKEIIVCSFEREVCGYISDAPAKKKTLEYLLAARCNVCGDAMQLKYTREEKKPFLGCVKGYQVCKGADWLDPPPPAAAKKGKSAPRK